MISFTQLVNALEMNRCLKKVKALLPVMKPGFRLLTDLTGLERMEVSCAVSIGIMMDLCDKYRVGAVLTVVPDASKDIGFDLMGLFHYNTRVTTMLYPNLAEAVGSLIEPVPSGLAH